MRQARQLVSHGHILVNGRRVDVPSARVRPGSASRPPAARNFLPVREALEVTPDPPRYLERDKDAVRGTLIRLPERAEIPLPVESTSGSSSSDVLAARAALWTSATSRTSSPAPTSTGQARGVRHVPVAGGGGRRARPGTPRPGRGGNPRAAATRRPGRPRWPIWFGVRLDEAVQRYAHGCPRCGGQPVPLPDAMTPGEPDRSARSGAVGFSGRHRIGQRHGLAPHLGHPCAYRSTASSRRTPTRLATEVVQASTSQPARGRVPPRPGRGVPGPARRPPPPATGTCRRPLEPVAVEVGAGDDVLEVAEVHRAARAARTSARR